MFYYATTFLGDHEVAIGISVTSKYMCMTRFLPAEGCG